MQKLIEQYGQPDEVTNKRLIWHKNGLWKRTELIDEEIPHKFPEPHYDSLLQVIPYRVPPQAGSDLLQFDGSVVVERTRGELAARCDDETANYLALNLAHEIILGEKASVKPDGSTPRPCSKRSTRNTCRIYCSPSRRPIRLIPMYRSRRNRPPLADAWSVIG